MCVCVLTFGLKNKARSRLVFSDCLSEFLLACNQFGERTTRVRNWTTGATFMRCSSDPIANDFCSFGPVPPTWHKGICRPTIDMRQTNTRPSFRSKPRMLGRRLHISALLCGPAAQVANVRQVALGAHGSKTLVLARSRERLLPVGIRQSIRCGLAAKVSLGLWLAQ